MDPFLVPAYVAAMVFEILIPLLLILWLKKRFKLSWRLFAYGAGMAFLFQLVLFIILLPLELPLVDFLLSFSVEQLVVFLVLIGALFSFLGVVVDEVGKYLSFDLIPRFVSWVANKIGFRPSQKKKGVRGWKPALFFGAGWGSIGMFILAVGVALSIPDILMLSSIGSEGYIAMLNATGYFTEEELFEQWQLVEGLSWADPFLDIIDGVSMLILSTSMSLLIMQVFTQKRIIFLPTAIGLHFIVSLSNVLGLVYGVVVSYILMLVLSVIVAFIAFRLSKVNLNELFYKSKRKRQAR